MIAVFVWLVILGFVAMLIVAHRKGEKLRANLAEKAGPRPVRSRKQLLALTRAELNGRAIALGINATRLPNKAAVADAIIKKHDAEIAKARLAVSQVLAAPQPTEYEVVTEGRRPTVTRTATGAVVAGPIGAIVGLAWRKKTRQTVWVVQRNRP